MGFNIPKEHIPQIAYMDTIFICDSSGFVDGLAGMAIKLPV
jgi:hypothetical protein